jgi:hypothetical protein
MGKPMHVSKNSAIKAINDIIDSKYSQYRSCYCLPVPALVLDLTTFKKLSNLHFVHPQIRHKMVTN